MNTITVEKQTNVVDVNLSAYEQNQQRNAARGENNDLLLEDAIREAVNESGLEATAHLIEECRLRFGHNGEKVYATSIFKTIPSFIDNYKGKVQRVASGLKPELTVQDRLDIAAREKKMAFETMLEYSKVGDQKNYLKARSVWASL